MLMVNVKGNLQKMLKIIERSKPVRVFLYFLVSVSSLTLLIYKFLGVWHG